MNMPTLIGNVSVTNAIVYLVAMGANEQDILARVAQHFPNLTTAELSAALQDATAAAEKQAMRRH